jgi:hypothetical protein
MRNKAAQNRKHKKWTLQINQIWRIGFIAYNLFDGGKLRALAAVDC